MLQYEYIFSIIISNSKRTSYLVCTVQNTVVGCTYYYSPADSKDETVQSSELLLHNSITIIQLSRSKSQCRSDVVVVLGIPMTFLLPRGNNAISCFHCSHIQISCFSPDEVTCSVANVISQTPCCLWVPDRRSHCTVLSHLPMSNTSSTCKSSRANHFLHVLVL